MLYEGAHLTRLAGLLGSQKDGATFFGRPIWTHQSLAKWVRWSSSDQAPLAQTQAQRRVICFESAHVSQGDSGSPGRTGKCFALFHHQRADKATGQSVRTIVFLLKVMSQLLASV